MVVLRCHVPSIMQPVVPSKYWHLAYTLYEVAPEEASQAQSMELVVMPVLRRLAGGSGTGVIALVEQTTWAVPADVSPSPFLDGPAVKVYEVLGVKLEKV